MSTVTSAEPRADGVIVTPTPVSGSGQLATGAGVISGAARPLTWTLAVTLRSEIPVRTMHLGSVETQVVDPPTVPGTLTSMGSVALSPEPPSETPAPTVASEPTVAPRPRFSPVSEPTVAPRFNPVSGLTVAVTPAWTSGRGAVTAAEATPGTSATAPVRVAATKTERTIDPARMLLLPFRQRNICCCEKENDLLPAFLTGASQG
jgi:hypothetical protein